MRLLPPPTAFSAAVVSAAVVVLLPVAPAFAATGGPSGSAPSGFTITDPRIKESSGLAASRIHPGVYWTHNDSDDGPYVYAVDSATGKTVARVTLTGIGKPRDVEAISLGPDGALYVGDIGDNRDGTWDHVWIYRFQEPKQLGDTTVKAEQFTVRYEDGPRNAEALMVHPVTGRVYIGSKSEDKGGLYEGPEKLSASGTNVFRRVAGLPWVTDGAFSPDGKRLTVRGYFLARTYPWKDGRPQGEGGADRRAVAGAGGVRDVHGRRLRPDVRGGGRGEPGGGGPGAGGPGAGPGPGPGPGPGRPVVRTPRRVRAAVRRTARRLPGGSFTKGALVLAGATAALFAAKRLFRRRPKP
ncbi:hypothetical protein GCM10020254_47650 [Streptomyces goshikiensis]